MWRMASKLSFGPDIADWQERINVARMRAERMERARSIMRRRGIPALLAAGQENTRYLTGLRGAEFMPQLWYVLFFAEHDPVVFAHAGFYHNMPEEAPWIQHWRIARSWLGGAPGPEATAEEVSRFADDIVEELRQRGLAGETVGVVAIDGLGQQALRDRGIELAPAVSLMQEARTVKTRDEINCMKMAEAITDSAWYRVRELLRPGINERDLRRAAIDAVLEGGVESVAAMNLRSGPTTFDRGVDRTNRLIQDGDLVYGAFCGNTFLGYRTCYYRTFKVGKVTAEERDWYKQLLDRMNGVIGEIKPGNTTADSAKHFPPADRWGYAEECELLTMEVGHGVGIAQYDPPIINRQWSLDHPQPFEPGMVIAVEGREGRPGIGGVRIEDIVVVTQDGCELIDHFPREEVTEV